MGKTLVIAEKPSVAKDIINVLAGMTTRFNTHTGYSENDLYVVSHAVGHLVEIYAEEAEKPPRWSLKNLPIIPEHFSLRPSEGAKDQLSVLVKLLQRKDIDTVINACDAGREGELIFRLILQHAQSKGKNANKVVKRLWLQSMTKEAIQDGFNNLRLDLHMKNLEDAARCRSEADWLIGINASRALTAYNSTNGSFNLTTAGRVQTPTLSLLTKREELIKEHKPRDYFELLIGVTILSSETYVGKYYNHKWKKSDDPEDKADRLWSGAELKTLQEGLLHAVPDSITDEAKAQVKHSPGLFDLTTLQREANSKFGMSAKNTLGVAQALYEKHKVLTYPRTDSKHLPEDYIPTVLSTLNALTAYEGLGVHAETCLRKNYVTKTKKVFDNSKISDHFAIVPTGKVPRGLDEYESRIYDLVLKRFMAAFFPPAEIDVVIRTTVVKDKYFKSEGKVLKVPGWMEIYGRGDDSNDVVLPVIEGFAAKSAIITSVDPVAKATKPPAPYNEATLLGAMETAGKHIEDATTKEAMKDKGLGTPATRASIIEGLLTNKYMVREGKDLHPTEKAKTLMELLKGLKIELLMSPEMTGQWESKLLAIEKGQMTRAEFMENISEVTKFIIHQAKTIEVDDKDDLPTVEGSRCPGCGSPLQEGLRCYICSKRCGVKLPKVVVQRPISPEEIVHITTTGPLGPVAGFRSRFNKTFEGLLSLGKNKKEDWDLLLSFPERSETPETLEPVGDPICECPACKSKVYDYGHFYSCEKLKECCFKVNKILLSRPIQQSEVTDLAFLKKTDELEGFVSKSKGRPFKAHLVWDEKKGVSFEFAEKVDKPKKPFKKHK